MAQLTLTMKQVADLIGTNLGTVLNIRAKGARLYDPTFPAMNNQTFDYAEVMAWLQTTKTSTTPVTDATTESNETKPGGLA